MRTLATGLSGTPGAAGNLAVWEADGSLGDGGAPPTTPTSQFALDASTVALWRMDADGSPEYDLAGGAVAYDLVADSGLKLAAGAVQGEPSRRIVTAGDHLNSGTPSDSGVALQAVLQGECTVDVWCYLEKYNTDASGDGSYLFQVANEGSNMWANLVISGSGNPAGAGYMIARYYTGSTFVSAQDPTLFPLRGWHLATWRKRGSGSSWYVDWLLDGVVLATAGPGANASGTGFAIGFGRINSAGPNAWYGRIGPSRISSIARTDAELQALVTAAGF